MGNEPEEWNDMPGLKRSLERGAVARRGSDGTSRGDAWLRWLGAMALAALVAYFTAIGAVRENVAEVKTTEQNHFDEVLRRLALIQAWQDRQDGRDDRRPR